MTWIPLATGEKAIASAHTVLYDLILMDLQMPGMDGFEAADAIRALKPYQNVPIWLSPRFVR